MMHASSIHAFPFRKIRPPGNRHRNKQRHHSYYKRSNESELLIEDNPNSGGKYRSDTGQPKMHGLVVSGILISTIIGRAYIPEQWHS